MTKHATAHGVHREERSIESARGMLVLINEPKNLVEAFGADGDAAMNVARRISEHRREEIGN
jgi:hypothetical protein